MSVEIAGYWVVIVGWGSKVSLGQSRIIDGGVCALGVALAEKSPPLPGQLSRPIKFADATTGYSNTRCDLYVLFIRLYRVSSI